MSRRIVTVSLEDFARTGALGPIRLGMSRQAIAKLLGRPGAWSVLGKSSGVAHSPIWKYGNLELFFADELWLIHFDDGFGRPTGEKRLRIRSWGIREGMTLKSLEGALTTAAIKFRTSPDVYNPGCVNVVTGAGVDFIVQVKGARAERGLKLFGHSAKCPTIST